MCIVTKRNINPAASAHHLKGCEVLINNKLTATKSSASSSAAPAAAAGMCGGNSSSSNANKKHRLCNKKNHPRLIVHHNYSDYANSPPPEIDHYAALARSGANTAFPLKLYDMLDRVEADGYSHVVSWQPHGRCFVVHRPDDFKELLPRYFKLSKIASFQRQLNLYGFTRLSSGTDRNGYYHERFLRGKPFLIEFMQRAKVKGTCVRARANPNEEPDFWNGMPWVGSSSGGYSNKGFSSSQAAATSTAPRRTQQQQQQAQVINVKSPSPLPSPPPLSVASPIPIAIACCHGSSSVISNEEVVGDERVTTTATRTAAAAANALPQHDDERDDGDCDCDPIPVSISTSSAVAATPQQQQQQHRVVEQDDGDIMTGWGCQFHYLGSLPDELPLRNFSMEETTVPIVCSSSSSSAGARGGQVPPVTSSSLCQQEIGGGGDEFMYIDFERVLNDLLESNDRVGQTLLGAASSRYN